MIHLGYATGAAAAFMMSYAIRAAPYSRDERVRNIFAEISREIKRSLSKESLFVLKEVIGTHLWQALLIRSFSGHRKELSNFDALRQDSVYLMSVSSLLFLGKMGIMAAIKNYHK